MQTGQECASINIVLSGASGVGKTTVIRSLLTLLPGSQFVVSCTTRPLRQGETEGVSYTHVSKEHFLHLIRSGGLVEWTYNSENYYGTPLARASSCRYFVYDVDLRGVENFRKCVHAKNIYIELYNTRETIVSRLRARGTNTHDWKRRMQMLDTHLAESPRVAFDARIVSDENAAANILAFVREWEAKNAVHNMHER